MRKEEQKVEKKAKISLEFLKIKSSGARSKAVIILTLAIFALNSFILMPAPAWARLTGFDYLAKIDKVGTSTEEAVLSAEQREFKNNLPKNEDLKVSYERKVVFTAYNSEVGQCDSTPCITANGFNVCQHGIEDTIAMNGIRMGTKIKVPELFGDRVFVVRDRMNARYGSDRGDIWMVNKADAKEFGVKFARVEILK